MIHNLQKPQGQDLRGNKKVKEREYLIDTHTLSFLDSTNLLGKQHLRTYRNQNHGGIIAGKIFYFQNIYIIISSIYLKFYFL